MSGLAFAVVLTHREREWVAHMILDAAAEADVGRAARLIEARIETLMQRRLDPLVDLAIDWEREALAESSCPDGLCGACTMGNLAHLVRAALNERNDDAE